MLLGFAFSLHLILIHSVSYEVVLSYVVCWQDDLFCFCWPMSVAVACCSYLDCVPIPAASWSYHVLNLSSSIVFHCVWTYQDIPLGHLAYILKTLLRCCSIISFYLICGCVAKRNGIARNGIRNCSSKTGSRRRSQKKSILKHFLKGILKGKSSVPKSKKSAAKAPFTRLTLPLQCDLRLSAAKRNSITHAAAARSNLDAAIPLRSANIELQNASFRARLPSNSKSRCENEAFVRCFFQIFSSWRDENEAFVRGFLQIPRFEEMKAKLSCKASFKLQELKRSLKASAD